MNKGLSGGQYRPLSEEQVETIHSASLEILEEAGFTFEAGLEDTVEMLERAGARIDRNRSRILFPRDLVLEQVRKAPEKFSTAGTGRTTWTWGKTGSTWERAGRRSKSWTWKRGIPGLPPSRTCTISAGWWINSRTSIFSCGHAFPRTFPNRSGM
jgi:hypothetical protein